MNTGQTPHVLVFTTAYLPYVGGAEIAIDQITRRIPKVRFSVITARFDKSNPKHEIRGNREIFRLGFGAKLDSYLLPFLGFLKARSIAKQQKNERLILWGMMVSQGTLGAYFFKKIYSQTSFLLTLQEGDSVEHIKKGRFGIIGLFWKATLHAADKVTVISHFLENFAKDFGYKGEVSLISNGVDDMFFHSIPEEAKRSLREKLGIPSEGKVILSVSRLVEKNGLFHLIEACARLEKDLHAYLVLIGEGPLREDLQRFAKSQGFEERVIFKGSVPHAELPMYYAMSDVFARPSLSEGLGNVFLEAMAAGAPVVATQTGGIIDIVIDKETGMLCSVGNIGEIAQAIKSLLVYPEKAEHIRKQGRVFVEKNYRWDTIAKAMERVLLSKII